jgi:hypothetical protein
LTSADGGNRKLSGEVNLDNKFGPVKKGKVETAKKSTTCFKSFIVFQVFRCFFAFILLKCIFACKPWRCGAVDIASASGTEEDPGSNPAFLGNHIAMLLCTIDLKCIICVLERNKGNKVLKTFHPRGILTDHLLLQINYFFFFFYGPPEVPRCRISYGMVRP